MKEITVEKSCEPPEISVIDPKRPAPAWEELVREDPQPIRDGRDKMIRNLSIIGAIQMMIIFLQWVVIYIMIPAVR